MTGQLDRIELNTGLTLTDVRNIITQITTSDTQQPANIGPQVNRTRLEVLDPNHGLTPIFNRLAALDDFLRTAWVRDIGPPAIPGQSVHDYLAAINNYSYTAQTVSIQIRDQNTTTIIPALNRIEAALTAGGGNPDIAPIMAQLAILMEQPRQSLNRLFEDLQVLINGLPPTIRADLTLMRDQINAATVTATTQTTTTIQADLEACCSQMISLSTGISASVGLELTLRVDDILAMVRGLFAQAEPDPDDLIGGESTQILIDTGVRYPVPGVVYDVEINTIPVQQDSRVSDPLNIPRVLYASEIDVTNTPFAMHSINFQRQRILSTSIETAGLLFIGRPGTVLTVTPYTRP